MNSNGLEIVRFSNQTPQSGKLLKKFVSFHWELYKDEPRFIPLFDYEYLGFKLLGITGWFEPRHQFFNHGEMEFIYARQNGKIVGRLGAFINYNYNDHYKEKMGFFGFFESVNDLTIARAMINAAEMYLKSRGMTVMRGPQNLPVNEATPGILIQGFDARPYIYYHYNYPYYAGLFENCGMRLEKKIVCLEAPVTTPVDDKLFRIARRVKEIYDIRIISFDKIHFKTLREHMFEIYNDAWQDNWGFVPFAKDEFYDTLDEMKMIWNPDLLFITYVKDVPAAFFGAIPNIIEKMKPIRGLRRLELLRLAKMFLTKKMIKSYRMGYFGIRSKYWGIGLDAVLIAEAKRYVENKKFLYWDVGWVLEDNKRALNLAKKFGGNLSRTYAIYRKELI